MNIYVDVKRAISCGVACAYACEVHWEIDDEDNLDREKLNELKDEVQVLVNDKLNDALHLSKTPLL